LRQEIAGVVVLQGPPGVRLQPARFEFTLGADQEQRLSATLLVPPGLEVPDKSIRATMTSDRLGTVARALALEVRQSSRCVRGKATLRVDGDLGEWLQAPTIELDKRSQVALGTVRPQGDPNPDLHYEWEGPEDLSAIARTQWDDENLYLGVTVRKKGILLNTSRQLGDLQAQYDGDCVELFLDLEEREGKVYGPNTYQIYFVPPTADFPSISWHVFQPPARELKGVQAVGKPTADGYVMEVRIPWSNFAGFKPTPGRIIGFDLAVDNQDKPDAQVHSFGASYRKCQLAWGENRAFSGDRSQFGRLILSD
jgi:hypothetical protein